MADVPREGHAYIGRRPNAKRRLVTRVEPGWPSSWVYFRIETPTGWSERHECCRLTSWRRWASDYSEKVNV
jgi:hypothetical protein